MREYLYLLAIASVLLETDAAHSSYCSLLHDKCMGECYKIKLDDILQKECFTECDEARHLCHKDHPECVSEDKIDSLQHTVNSLNYELRRAQEEVWHLKKNRNNQGKP